LVDCTGNQAGDFVGDGFIFAKYVRERRGKRRCALNAGEVNLANV
jgi:hypothetical protein